MGMEDQIRSILMLLWTTRHCDIVVTDRHMNTYTNIDFLYYMHHTSLANDDESCFIFNSSHSHSLRLHIDCHNIPNVVSKYHSGNFLKK